MFESDIQDKVKNSNLFEVVYKKDMFLLDGKEYSIGYTSYLAIQEECRFMDNKRVRSLLAFSDDILQDLTKDKLSYLHKIILSVLNSLKANPFFEIFDYDKYADKLNRLFSEERLEQYMDIYIVYRDNYVVDTAEKADKIDRLIRVFDDFILALSIPKILDKAVSQLTSYSSLVFQMTHRIVERGARNKSQLADAFGDFLNNPYLQFTFRTDTQPFKTRATVMPVIENVNGENHILRKVYYNNVKDFLNTDLFEGYIHGHYLWRCDICDRYFFMTTAHKQLYCSTKNPKYGVPCSYVAKHPEVVKRKMERQKKTDSPYYLIWQKRNDSIRKNKSLGKYDEAVSAKAKEYIDDRFDEAQINCDYAETQFEKDMEIENIYKAAKEMLDV